VTTPPSSGLVEEGARSGRGEVADSSPLSVRGSRVSPRLERPGDLAGWGGRGRGRAVVVAGRTGGMEADDDRRWAVRPLREMGVLVVAGSWNFPLKRCTFLRR